MTTFHRRTRPPYRSERHYALAAQYPADDEIVTRRFPRSMSEAFPCDARSAYAIEHTPRTRWIDRLCWIVAIALLAGLYSVRWN